MEVWKDGPKAHPDTTLKHSLDGLVSGRHRLRTGAHPDAAYSVRADNLGFSAPTLLRDRRGAGGAGAAMTDTAARLTQTHSLDAAVTATAQDGR
jgi:hypothetical protein